MAGGSGEMRRRRLRIVPVRAPPHKRSGSRPARACRLPPPVRARAKAARTWSEMAAAEARWRSGIRAGRLALLVAAPLLAACSLSETIGRHSVAYNSTVEARDRRGAGDERAARPRPRAAALHHHRRHPRRLQTCSPASAPTCSSLRNGVQPAVLGSSQPELRRRPAGPAGVRPRPAAPARARPVPPAVRPRPAGPDCSLHLLVSRFDEGRGRALHHQRPERPPCRSTPAARAACAEAGRRRAAALRPVPGGGGQPHPARRLLFNGYTRLIPLGPRLTRGAGRRSPQVLADVARVGPGAPPGWAGLAALPRRSEQIVICVPSAPGGHAPLHRAGAGPRRAAGLGAARRRRPLRRRRGGGPADPGRPRRDRRACPGTCAPSTKC